jgi:hypothetical protein
VWEDVPVGAEGWVVCRRVWEDVPVGDLQDQVVGDVPEAFTSGRSVDGLRTWSPGTVCTEVISFSFFTWKPASIKLLHVRLATVLREARCHTLLHSVAPVPFDILTTCCEKRTWGSRRT